MLAIIEIGNSHISVACLEGAKPVFTRRVDTDILKTDLEYVIEFRKVLAEEKLLPESVEGVVISSAVPRLQNTVALAARRIFGKEPMVIGPDSATGFEIALKHPQELGSNLLCSAAAAVHDYGAPVILVNMGVATSIGVIDENRRYLGGALLPGMQSSLRAFTNITTLPEFRITNMSRDIGRTTIDAMNCGSLYGNAGMIDALLSRMIDELHTEKPVKIVATGRQSEILMPYLTHEIIPDRDLSLRGMYYIFTAKGGAK